MLSDHIDVEKGEEALSGGLVGKLYALLGIVAMVVTGGAGGIAGIVVLTDVVGWGSAAAVGFASGFLLALVSFWLVGPWPWKYW